MRNFNQIKLQKGEGIIGLLIFLAVVAGIGYGVYVYFNPTPTGSGATGQEVSATPTPSNGNGAQAGSPAGAAVQGAQAAGELMGSGR